MTSIFSKFLSFLILGLLPATMTFAYPIHLTTPGALTSACILSVPQKICVTATFSEKPVKDIDAPFVLSFYDVNADGTAQKARTPAAHFKVDIFMPEMGHGSSPVKTSPMSAEGMFAVHDVYFVMAGEWLIRITFEHETLSIPVTVP